MRRIVEQNSYYLPLFACEGCRRDRVSLDPLLWESPNCGAKFRRVFSEVWGDDGVSEDL